MDRMNSLAASDGKTIHCIVIRSLSLSVAPEDGGHCFQQCSKIILKWRSHVKNENVRFFPCQCLPPQKYKKTKVTKVTAGCGEIHFCWFDPKKMSFLGV